MLGILVLWVIADTLMYFWNTRHPTPTQPKEEDRDRDYGAPW